MARMLQFEKRLRREDAVRRYVIHSTESGWEVVEQHGTEVVRKLSLQDWHRVERVRRSLAQELDELVREGWKEVGN